MGPENPPAFPNLQWDGSAKSEHYYNFGGMSLRDYFAGQALAGICGDGIPGSHHSPKATAHDAYAYADAMLAARQSPPEREK